MVKEGPARADKLMLGVIDRTMERETSPVSVSLLNWPCVIPHNDRPATIQPATIAIACRSRNPNLGQLVQHMSQARRPRKASNIDVLLVRKVQVFKSKIDSCMGGLIKTSAITKARFRTNDSIPIRLDDEESIWIRDPAQRSSRLKTDEQFENSRRCRRRKCCRP